VVERVHVLVVGEELAGGVEELIITNVLNQELFQSRYRCRRRRHGQQRGAGVILRGMRRTRASKHACTVTRPHPKPEVVSMQRITTTLKEVKGSATDWPLENHPPL
ncbi:unnamed protein product, partial [Ectocarpus sp. 12 AP-2014]